MSQLPVKKVRAKSIFKTHNTLKPLDEIKVTGGSFPAQNCRISDGLWRFKLSSAEGVAYIPRAALVGLEKITETGRNVTFKAKFFDGRTIVAEATKSSYAALYAEMETGAKPGDAPSTNYSIEAGLWKRRFQWVILSLLLLLLIPIVNLMMETGIRPVETTAPYIPPPAPVALASTPEEVASICKATISAIMGTDLKIINSTPKNDGEVSVSYNRASDGQFFAYRCKLEGTRVLWASDTGRWRNHPMDEVITYALTADAVTITQAFPDGSSITDNFALSALR